MPEAEGEKVSLFQDRTIVEDYLKKFFYQILGIYFPPIILFLYFFLFWFTGIGNNPVAYYNNDDNFGDGWPRSLLTNNINTLSTAQLYNQNQVLSSIVLLIAIIITGEGINSVTSRFSILSPARYNPIRLHKNPQMVKWPSWISDRFPVSFSQFDRYYISALEQDRRVLAGKIGWISFYRNFVAVFVIIFISQIILVASTKFHGYEFYVLGLTSLYLIFFLYGYFAQIKSNKATLWDAYRRYELAKNLEIRKGDMLLSLGVKEENKKVAIDYIVDRLVLAEDESMGTVSRYLLNRTQDVYLQLLENHRNPSTSMTDKDLEYRAYNSSVKILSKIKNRLDESYVLWDKGNYESVFSNAFITFEEMHLFLREHKSEIEKDIQVPFFAEDKKGEWNIFPTEDDWNEVLGLYILERNLRRDSAFLEIDQKISQWGWIIEEKKESIKDNRRSNDSKTQSVTETLQESIHEYYEPDHRDIYKDFEQMANLVRETSNRYHEAYFKIRYTIITFNEVLGLGKLDESDKQKCFDRLRKIYRLFGGYEYDKAYDEASKFFTGIYQSGSGYLHLKSERDVDSFNGYISNVPEGAIVTEIINPTPYTLTLSYGATEALRKKFRLAPYSQFKLDGQYLGIMAAGKWTLNDYDSEDIKLPEQVNVEIRWKAPITVAL